MAERTAKQRIEHAIRHITKYGWARGHIRQPLVEEGNKGFSRSVMQAPACLIGALCYNDEVLVKSWCGAPRVQGTWTLGTTGTVPKALDALGFEAHPTNSFGQIDRVTDWNDTKRRRKADVLRRLEKAKALLSAQKKAVHVEGS